MAVSRDISEAVMRDELALMKELAQTFHWTVEPEFDQLKVTVSMHSHNNEKFIVEAQCDNYKEQPPLFEFIHHETNERGVPRAYPKSKDSLFHPSGPCICAPFNRKAYKKLFDTGPHEDWQLGDWMTSTANGYSWANHTKLGDMFGLIQYRLIQPSEFLGRLG